MAREPIGTTLRPVAPRPRITGAAARSSTLSAVRRGLPRRVGRHDRDEPRRGGGHQEPLDAEPVGAEHDDDVGAVGLRHCGEQRLDRPQADEAERGGVVRGQLDPGGGQPRRVRLQPVEQGALAAGVLRLPTGGAERATAAA